MDWTRSFGRSRSCIHHLNQPKPLKSNAALSHQYQTIGVGAQILRDLGVENEASEFSASFQCFIWFHLEVVEYITADQITAK
jgi:3,4-dihydroxy 2-butanone 4-phosphate synthase/GTP cyclohydrolase II